MTKKGIDSLPNKKEPAKKGHVGGVQEELREALVGTPPVEPKPAETPPMEAVAEKVVPPELGKIYGDNVPAEVLEMYEKLGGSKRESYLEQRAAEQEEKKKKVQPVSAEKDIASNERQQTRLIKATLFLGDQSGRLDPTKSDAPLTPEDRQKFLDLLSNPETRDEKVKTAQAYIERVIQGDPKKNDRKKEEYSNQLVLLMREADLYKAEKLQTEEKAMGEKQQNKLIKALLADKGEISKILAEREKIIISPEERAQAMALLSDPSQQGKAMRIIEQIGSLKKQTEYVAQLELLRAKAEQEKAAPTEPLPAVFRKYPRGKKPLAPEFDLHSVLEIETLTNEINLPPVQPERTPVSARQRQEELYKLFKQKQIEVEAPHVDGTRAEWQEKLRKLIGGAKEKFNWYKSSEEGLIRRNEELDTQLEKIGGVEKGFRWMGEKYNKLGWKSKLGIGIALGLGAGLSAPVNMAVAAGFLSGIAAQRIAGLATMYLKFEKSGLEKGGNFAKEKAMAKAILYTAGMTAGIMYAVKEISDHDLVGRTKEWLGSYFGHHPVAPTAAAPRPAAPEVPAGQERFGDDYGSNYEAMQAAHPEYQSASGAAIPPSAVEAVAPAVEVEMPSVGATAGRGYEWMAKRLWEQLQEKPLDLQTLHNLPPDSDIHKLLAADAATIDKVVHQIAANSERGFFKPDGTSVRIDLGSQMTINAEGNIQLGEVVKAPEGAKVTPVYPQSEAPTSIGPTPKMQPIMDFGSEAPLQSETISQPVSRVDLTPGQIVTPVEQSTAPPERDNSVLRSGDGSVVTTSDGSPVRLGESIPQPGTNAFGIEVSTTKSNIYLGADGKILAFGDTQAEEIKRINSYFSDPGHADHVVYGKSSDGMQRIPWGLREGEVIPIGAPVEKPWWVKLFSKSPWMEGPSANELKSLIKY